MTRGPYRFPLRNRWLILKFRWPDATWRQRGIDLLFLLRG